MFTNMPLLWYTVNKVKSKVKQIAMMEPVFVCDPLATTHEIGLIASGLLCLHEVNVELDLYKSIIACLA